MNAALAAAAATANITVNKQLIVVESAVAQATSHLELTRARVDQAHVAADEASHVQKPHPRRYRPLPHVRTNDERERTD